MDWSDDARRICGRIARENPQATPEELHALLRAAYPWGPRSHWPYRAWCKAQRRELDARRNGVFFRAGDERPCEGQRGCLFRADVYEQTLTGMLVPTIRVRLCAAHALLARNFGAQLAELNADEPVKEAS